MTLIVQQCPNLARCTENLQKLLDKTRLPDQEPSAVAKNIQT
jgi:hypothetical protein